MSIYDRPVKTLMREFATAELKPGRIFDSSLPVSWFQEHYSKIKPNTVQMHVESMSINSPRRRHAPTVRPGSGHDLFYKLGPRAYRLWDEASDPAPRYGDDAGSSSLSDVAEISEDGAEERDAANGGEFAFERDLRNYLEKNLSLLEAGLRVYEEEGLTGIEYPAGTRRIDILATAADDAFVVIELKVSRGYDRVVGQIMRYMAWVKANMADGKSVRGIIVASDISEDLRLAASLIPDVKLVEYELAFKLKPVA